VIGPTGAIQSSSYICVPEHSIGLPPIQYVVQLPLDRRPYQQGVLGVINTQVNAIALWRLTSEQIQGYFNQGFNIRHSNETEANPFIRVGVNRVVFLMQLYSVVHYFGCKGRADDF
jgi:hypothetical protein